MAKRKKNIADELRKAIARAERAGQTQYAIAKAAGMPQSQVKRVAEGQSDPTLRTAERIALAVGCKLTITPIVAK
jgi:transcriptional regulator with XRE-family HTH domain